MRVLIYEPQFMGHNLAFAARMIRAMAELPCQTFLATSRLAAQSHEFGVHVSGLRDQCEVIEQDGFEFGPYERSVRTNGPAGIRAAYRGLRDAITQVRPDHVYVPYGNHLARLACLPRGLASWLKPTRAEAETLLIGGRYVYPAQRWGARARRKMSLGAIARGPWTTVFHLEPTAVESMQGAGGRLAERVRLMPDPVEPRQAMTKQDARRVLGAPEAGRQVVVVGLIDKRKGVAQLAAAFRALGERLNPDDRLVLAGSFHPEMRELVDSEYADLQRSGRLVCLNRKLSDSEFVAAGAAGDVVATVYPQHRYTSSIVVAAAAAGRPVLGAKVGWMGRVIPQFGLGRVCNPHNPADVEEKLLATLNDAATFRATPSIERFVAFHSTTNFAAHWTSRLRARLNVPQSDDLLSWDWTTAGERMAA